MLDMRDFGPGLTHLSRALALVAVLGAGGAVSGCGDIHPAPNDTGGGIIDAPTDEAVHERENEERADEHGMDQQQHNR